MVWGLTVLLHLRLSHRRRPFLGMHMCLLSIAFSESPYSDGTVVGEWFLGNVVYTVCLILNDCEYTKIIC